MILKSLKALLIILLAASLVPPLFFMFANMGGEGSDDSTMIGFLTNAAYSIAPTLALTTGCTLTINFLQKRLSWGKSPALRLAVEVLCIAILTIIVAYLFTYANPLIVEGMNLKSLFFTNLLFNLAITFFIVTIVEATFFFNQWKQTRIEREQLEKEHYKAQFQNLKNQINPHLLFNSLNALTGLIENDSEKAVSYVQDLSRYLRMVLNHTNNEAISIEEELSLLRYYYSL